MKNVLLILLTGALLASCAPKSDTTGTTTDTSTTTDSATTDTTGTDTAATDSGATDPAAPDSTASDSTDSTATDPATTDSTAAGTTDGTLSNADDANMSEEMDMAAGSGLEGTVTEFDGAAKTFTLNENDANYAVTVSDATVFEGGATTAEEFFGSDRANANVAVEGQVNEGQNELVATKITLN